MLLGVRGGRGGVGWEGLRACITLRVVYAFEVDLRLYRKCSIIYVKEAVQRIYGVADDLSCLLHLSLFAPIRR